MPRATANGLAAAYAEFEEDDSDPELFENDNGKRGKRDPKSTQQRKAQNRQAQREFRQRRLAYVRDLEARVQLLSSPHDDQVNTLRDALTAMVDENKQLRKLCNTLAAFIGEQITGALKPTGLTKEDLAAVFNRGETDTMHDSFARSAEKYDLPPIESVTIGPPNNPSVGPQKRRRSNDGEPPAPLTLRSPQQPANGRLHIDTQMFSPTHPAPPTFYPSSYDPPSSAHSSVFDARMWSDPFLGASSAPSPAMPILSQSHDSFTSSSASFSPPTMATFAHRMSLPGEGRRSVTEGHDYTPPLTAPAGGPLRDIFVDVALATASPQVHADPIIMQAIQLIGYHLANRRANMGYPLPTCLVPTPLQQSIPHDRIIDGLIWPSMRDRLLTMPARYDLRELLTHLLENIEIHGEDLLEPTNWEIRDNFVRNYASIIDDGIIESTNRWRRERGEREIVLRELPERPGPMPARTRSF